MCRSTAGAAGDSVASIRLIEDDGGNGYAARQLRAYYDSLGSPFGLLNFAMDTATVERVHGVQVRFAPGGMATYSSRKADSATRARLKQSNDTNSVTDLHFRPMTQSEIA